MTQPALSQQLKTLEYDLGKNLFDRKGRRLVLNEFGSLVREYGNKIFRQTEEMLQVLSSDSLEFTKTFRIGAVPWIPKNILYDFIRPVIINPYIRIESQNQEMEVLISRLRNSQLDMILSDSPYTGRVKNLVSHRLNTEPIVCVSSTKVKLRGKFPDVLDGKRIVNFPESCLTSDKIIQFLDRKKVDTQIIGDFSDLEFSLFTVLKGGALGFFPKSYVAQAVKEKKLKSWGELDKIKFSLWAVTRKDYRKEGLISSVMDEFRQK